LGDAEKKICLQPFDILSFSGLKLGFNVFQKKITQKNSQKMKISNFFLNFFFNKVMLSECSLAISCYFYTPKYPKKNTTATVGFIDFKGVWDSDFISPQGHYKCSKLRMVKKCTDDQISRKLFRNFGIFPIFFKDNVSNQSHPP
jgi:hypothetical protein